MPSGSRIVLRTAAEADIPTPDTDQIAFFANSDESDEPTWKDEAGVFHSLQGQDGALTYQDHGNTGATETVDASAADVHRLVANAATVTLTLSGAAAAGTPTIIRLLLVQDGTGGRDWAFPGSVDFGGAEPTWTSRAGGVIDIVDLTTVDGGTLWVASFQPDSAGIDWGEDADITDQDYDDVADAGVLNEVARADHLHGMPSAGGGGSLAVGVTNLTGSDLTTTSSSYADVAGATVTISTGAHRVLIHATGTVYNSSSGANSNLTLCVDGTAVQGTKGYAIRQITGGSDTHGFSISWVSDVLTAASHTFKLQWKTDAGTLTLWLSGTANFQIAAMELSA